MEDSLTQGHNVLLVGAALRVSVVNCVVDHPDPQLSRTDESRRTTHVRAVTSTCTELQPISKFRGGLVGWGRVDGGVDSPVLCCRHPGSLVSRTLPLPDTRTLL